MIVAVADIREKLDTMTTMTKANADSEPVLPETMSDLIKRLRERFVQERKGRKGNAYHTVRRLARTAIEIYGGVGPNHSFGTTDLNRQLHERGLAAEIGLQGNRSVCAALQRSCEGSKQRKAHLPLAFGRDGTRWWVTKEYAAEYLEYEADQPVSVGHA